jgi:MFS family permease
MIEERRFRGAILNTCIGSLVFVLLGSLWAVFGLWSLHGNGTLIFAVSLGLCAFLLFIVSIYSIRKVLRLPQDILSTERRERVARIKRRFGLVNLLQGIAIGASFTLGFIFHLPDYIPPIVALIVGLHFIAIAPILQIRFDYIIGVLLCLLSLATVFMLPVNISVSNKSSENIFLWGAVTGIGSAIVLWVGAISRLMKVRAALRM